MLQYVTMPIEILELPNLNIQEKFILSLAKTLTQGCFLSNSQIASMLGISKGRVSHIISKLVKEGYLDITLEYKPNSKEVDKRTITFKQSVQQVVEAVKEVAKKVSQKAKQLKQDYVTTKATVGTQQVDQVTFAPRMYNRQPANNKTKFTTTYSHNWDMEELLRREEEYIEKLYGDDRG